jgi:hypothetical protein
MLLKATPIVLHSWKVARGTKFVVLVLYLRYADKERL